MPYLTININSIEGSTPVEEQKIRNACEMLEVILNSDEFYNTLMKSEFTTTSLTNIQVYNKIFSGVEVENLILDNQATLNIRFFYSNRNIGGTANIEDNIIRFNTKYLLNGHISNITSTMVHEWLHNLGFEHNGFGDRNSVPYRVGKIVQNLVKKYSDRIYELGIPNTKKIFTCNRPWYFLWLIKICKFKGK